MNENAERSSGGSQDGVALSFSSSGILAVYHLGVAMRLVRDTPFMSQVKEVLGASGGSLVAAAVVCSDVNGLDRIAQQIRSGRAFREMNWYDLWDPADRIVPRLIQEAEVLQDDSYKHAKGRLSIQVSELDKDNRTAQRKGRLVQMFSSNEELMSALQASCSFSSRGVQLEDGQRYWDGGMTCSMPCSEGRPTVCVSPFSAGCPIAAGPHIDICPVDQSLRLCQCCPSWSRSICGLRMELSLRNLKRCWDACVPPNSVVLDAYVHAGACDAERFLTKRWPAYSTITKP